MSFDLFGTTTSPFVRRVRVVAMERNIPFTFIDVNTAEGQATLRSMSPIWKAPTVRFDDGVVAWDSRVIIDMLCSDGWAPLRAPPLQRAARADEENVVNVIDEGLLALIRRYYPVTAKAPLDLPWLEKDFARTKNILAWLETRVREDKWVGAYGAGQGFGRAELALYTATQWMRFRNMIDVDQFPKLVAFEKSWHDRPSLAATKPGEPVVTFCS
jgi:glutathione S-transferase